MSTQTSHRPATGSGQRRRGSFYFGLVLVLGGFGVLGYVAWQLFGTNVVARQAQEQAVAELREDWSVRGSLQDRPDAVKLGDASALIRIPRFGDDYVMPVLEGIGNKELSSGFGHFPKAAGPGQRGNYALAAHRVTHGEPLRDMPDLRPGDEVLVETRKTVYTYALDTDPNELVVTFEEVWVIDAVPTNPDTSEVQPPSQQPGQRLLTLTTCAELFHTDNRLIAFGHLIDTETKTPDP